MSAIHPLKPIMSITADRVWTANPDGSHDELRLFVNGGGQILALTPAQIKLHGEAEQSEPKPAAPPPATANYQQTQPAE